MARQPAGVLQSGIRFAQSGLSVTSRKGSMILTSAAGSKAPRISLPINARRVRFRGPVRKTIRNTSAARLAV